MKHLMNRFFTWAAAYRKNRQLQRDNWQKNAAKFAAFLVQDVSLVALTLSPASIWVRVDRLIFFEGLPEKKIARLIKIQLEHRVESFELETRRTKDPAIFLARITNVVFIHHHPAVPV